MEIENYISKAQTRQGVNSLNQLSKFAGVSTTALSNFINNRAYPSDSTILKIADLAGVPAEQALIDVSLWRNKDNPEVLAVWQKLQKKLTKS